MPRIIDTAKTPDQAYRMLISRLRVRLYEAAQYAEMYDKKMAARLLGMVTFAGQVLKEVKEKFDG